MEHDWAQYYDKVENMDTKVGEVLDELKKEGLAENTIVFYYSDHGGVLGRSKRFMYTKTTDEIYIKGPDPSINASVGTVVFSDTSAANGDKIDINR